MEVRVNGAPFAVIMRTPGADRDLAAGFLLAEDVIRSVDEIGAIEYCADAEVEGRDNTINVTVLGDAVARLEVRLGDRRQVMMTASCGLCGRRTIESLQSRVSARGGDVDRAGRRHRVAAGPPARGAGRCSSRPAACMRRGCSIARARCNCRPKTSDVTTRSTRSPAARCSQASIRSTIGCCWSRAARRSNWCRRRCWPACR